MKNNLRSSIRWVGLLVSVLLLLMLSVGTVHAQGGSPGSPVEIPKLTADLLFSVTGVALSVLAYVIPPFRRFQERLGEWTPAFMAGALFVVAVLYQAVWCQYDLNCVVANWQWILIIWGMAFGTNAGAYKALIKPAKKRAEKPELPSWVDEEEIEFAIAEDK